MEKIRHRRGGLVKRQSGRSKVSAKIRDLARVHGAQAIERLVALMDSHLLSSH